MEQIIKSYGKSILTVIVILLILTALYASVYSMPGSSRVGNFFDAMNESVDNTDTVLDDATVDEQTTTQLEALHSVKAPSLAVKKDTCFKNTKYDATDFVKTDNNCKLVISEVDYLDDKSEAPYESDGTSVTFKKTGVYKLQITSTSSNTNLKTIKDLEVSVQRKI